MVSMGKIKEVRASATIVENTLADRLAIKLFPKSKVHSDQVAVKLSRTQENNAFDETTQVYVYINNKHSKNIDDIKDTLENDYRIPTESRNLILDKPNVSESVLVLQGSLSTIIDKLSSRPVKETSETQEKSQAKKAVKIHSADHKPNGPHVNVAKKALNGAEHTR